MKTSSLTGLDYDDLLMLRDGIEILQPDDEALDRQGRLMAQIVYEIERRKVQVHEKTYDVIVTRDTTESCCMVVSAHTAVDAEEAALDRANSDDDLVWERDDTPNASKHPYVTNVEEIERPKPTHFCVGWNIPGYLPDADDTYVYATFEEARAGIIDELNRAADDYGDEDEALRTPYELAIAEFEAATEPRTVMVNDYAWWIEPTTDPVTGGEDS